MKIFIQIKIVNYLPCCLSIITFFVTTDHKIGYLSKLVSEKEDVLDCDSFNIN